MDWKLLLKAALFRALKTFCEMLASLIGTQQIGIHQLDWPNMLSITATATLLSVLWSVAGGLPEVKMAQEIEAPDKTTEGE